MKFESLVLTGCLVWATGLISCDANEATDLGSTFEVAEKIGSSDRMPGRRKVLAEVGGRARTRREAASADSSPIRRTRFESRIGLQPWPDELPAGWPTPRLSRVVAVTSQRHGNRLLLVDIPGTPDDALASYRADLEAAGYRVARPQPQSGQRRHAIHARRGDTEAVLTFFGRDQMTRLEILFVEPSSR